MTVLGRGEASSAATPVLDVFTRVGSPFGPGIDVVQLEWQIWDITGSPVQVWPAVSGQRTVASIADAPAGNRLGTGHYYANFVVPAAMSLGTHQVRWYFRTAPGGPEYAAVTDFTVLAEPTAQTQDPTVPTGRVRPARTSRAQGYWGRNARKIIVAHQYPERLLVQLRHALLANGRPAYLYLPAHAATPFTTRCTCFKDTQASPDRQCRSCYGTGHLPGYTRFLSEDLWFGSAESAGWVFTNTELRTDLKPHRIRLVAGQTTGTIVTHARGFSNTLSAGWTYEVVSYLQGANAANASVLVEFSTNAGLTWSNISAVNGAGMPTGAGTIALRITLTRAAAADDSPEFEIARLRHLRADDVNAEIARRRTDGDYAPGQILTLNPWEMRQVSLHATQGYTEDNVNERAWTAPLDFFDNVLTPNTAGCRIPQDLPGPKPFLERAFGISQGRRYIVTQVSHSEQMLTFTHQAFSERLVQQGEVFSRVF